MAGMTEPRLSTFKTTGDFSSKQYCFAKLSADDSVVAAGAGESTDGIMQDAPASGEFGSVALQGGGAKLKIAGTVTRGQYLKSDANGAGLAATADKDVYGAKAAVSGVSGDVIAVEVMQGTLSV